MRIDIDNRDPVCWKCAEEKIPLYSVVMTVASTSKASDLFCGAYVVAICDDCRKELS